MAECRECVERRWLVADDEVAVRSYLPDGPVEASLPADILGEDVRELIAVLEEALDFIENKFKVLKVPGY